VAAPIPVKS
jgi:hypothetical protein